MARAGFSGYFYFSLTQIDRVIGGSPGVTDVETIRAAAGFTDVGDAIDITPAADSETIETTTRSLARQGKKGELEIYNSGTIDFTVSSELYTDVNDPVYKLIKAGLEGVNITLLDLNEAVTVDGAWGQCGLYKLSASPSAPKALKSHQTLSFKATLQNFAGTVIFNGTNLINFVDLV